ncbi:hypothetical protein [Candidatus Neptunichlamydia sp. REUL1]|uniref:hypothetical protein n=1 Tax=Candidatus Neptunichlamydia sp. REUL1 TaxID=3064277 RepID=UPI00293100D5|nr:hypothetical protein [Candidatus Neptunochlamydia sp. REUL1]
MRLASLSRLIIAPGFFISKRPAHSLATGSKSFTAKAVEEKASSVALRNISDYANIFTQSEGKVIIHATIDEESSAKKRMTFVKLYMYANYLIGNREISLLDLTKVCNKEGYKSILKGSSKRTPVQSGNFKSSLKSNQTKNLFQLFDDEYGKLQISLTNKGLHQVQNLADRLNFVDFKEPQGKLKDILTIIKKENLLKDANPVYIKNLAKSCAKNEYIIQTGNLRSLLSRKFAKQLFIFDRERDTVKLSPIGIKTINKITCT